jgi:hypothetical protein
MPKNLLLEADLHPDLFVVNGTSRENVSYGSDQDNIALSKNPFIELE